MHVTEIDTDKTDSGLRVTKDTAISLAVLLPVIGLFVGAVMWFTTVHAKVDATKTEVEALKKEVGRVQVEQKQQLDRYIEIKVQLGELKGLMINKNK